MSKILGIDLGTSISKMASIINGEPKCIETREGSVLMPSVVALASLAKGWSVFWPKDRL